MNKNNIQEIINMIEQLQQLDEKKMTADQLAKREEIVMGLKKSAEEFKNRYGDRAKGVMYATATKMAMKESDGISAEDLANSISWRIVRTKPELFTKFGLEVVGDVIMNVAEFHEGAEEVGTSDISGMVHSVIRQLNALAAEKVQEDSKVYRHKGTYGTSYDPSDDEKKQLAKKDTGVVRGRGRPKKGSDGNTGEVKSWDWSAFGADKKDVKLPKWKGNVVKHKIADESVEPGKNQQIYTDLIKKIEQQRNEFDALLKKHKKD